MLLRNMQIYFYTDSSPLPSSSENKYSFVVRYGEVCEMR